MANDTKKIQVQTHTGKRATVSGVCSLNGNRLFRISYQGKSGHIKQIELVKSKVQARQQLADAGVMVTSDKDWNAIMAAIEDVKRFPVRPYLETPGWAGGYYAEASGRVHSPAGARKGRAIFTPLQRAADSVRGTHEEWLRLVAQPITGQVIPMVMVLAALAAPLVRFVENQNFGFELWGPAGRGKTTGLRLMASIAGPPSNIATFNSTQAGREDMFPTRQDMPFPIDETNLVAAHDRQAMRDFTFRMANGTVRVSAVAKDRAQYRFIFAVSSNRPFNEVMGEIDADTSAAALQRLFPLSIGNSALGIFSPLPNDFTTSGAFAIALTNAMEEQYGTAYRAFIGHLVDARHRNSDQFHARLNAKIEEFAVIVGVSGTSQGRTRASTAFGLLYATGEFAKARGVIPAGWDCLAACVAAYRNYQAQVPGQTPLASRLATVLARPDTLDTRSAATGLTKRQVERHGAFIFAGIKGRTELLMTRSFRRTHFPDWHQLQATPDFRALNLGRGKRKEVQRNIRGENIRDWFACFRLPLELIPPLKR